MRNSGIFTVLRIGYSDNLYVAILVLLIVSLHVAGGCEITWACIMWANMTTSEIRHPLTLPIHRPYILNFSWDRYAPRPPWIPCPECPGFIIHDLIIIDHPMTSEYSQHLLGVSMNTWPYGKAKRSGSNVYVVKFVLLIVSLRVSGECEMTWASTPTHTPHSSSSHPPRKLR